MALLSASGVNINGIVAGVTKPTTEIAGGLLGSGTVTGVIKKLGFNVQGLLLGGNPTYMQFENPAYIAYQQNLTPAQAEAKATKKATQLEKITKNVANQGLQTLSRNPLGKMAMEKLGIKEAIPQEPNKYLSIYFDIIKSVNIDCEQEIPQHPIETGYVISDNITNKPRKITVVAGFSTSPVTWINKNGRGKSKLQQNIQSLNEFRDYKVTTSLYRNDGTVYSDLALANYSYAREDDSLSVIWVNLTFTEIIKVSTEVIDMPPDIVDKANQGSAGGSGTDGSATQGGGSIENGNRNRSALRGAWEWGKSTLDALGFGAAFNSGRAEGYNLGR